MLKRLLIVLISIIIFIMMNHILIIKDRNFLKMIWRIRTCIIMLLFISLLIFGTLINLIECLFIFNEYLFINTFWCWWLIRFLVQILLLICWNIYIFNFLFKIFLLIILFVIVSLKLRVILIDFIFCLNIIILFQLSTI